ncbi:Oxidase ustYa [Paramyrothecium foliicola]|nr:Oxidase ustYa [Paramyrothecium foliicola]
MDSSGYRKVSSHDEEEVPTSLIVGLKRASTWHSRYTTTFRALRVVVEVILFVSVVALLLSNHILSQARSSNFKPMPNFAYKGVLFRGDPNFVSAATFANVSALDDARAYWTKMTVKGRGAILVDSKDRTGLSPPYEIPIPEDERVDPKKDTEEVYMIAVFHQLHCLSTLMTSYGRAVISRQPPEDLEHDAHCFDLLRQALLCAADTTVEGQTSHGLGWGSVHQCKDMDAIKAWIEPRAAFGWHQFPDAFLTSNHLCSWDGLGAVLVHKPLPVMLAFEFVHELLIKARRWEPREAHYVKVTPQFDCIVSRGAAMRWKWNYWRICLDVRGKDEANEGQCRYGHNGSHQEPGRPRLLQWEGRLCLFVVIWRFQ